MYERLEKVPRPQSIAACNIHGHRKCPALNSLGAQRSNLSWVLSGGKGAGKRVGEKEVGECVGVGVGVGLRGSGNT